MSETDIERLPEEHRPEQYHSLHEVFQYVVSRHGEQRAYTCMDRTLTYSEVDELSDRFCHHLLTQTELKSGDRIAIQLPNLLQFPIALFGAMKAGLIVVNTNPLYTSNEMLHQFKDSGVKGIVILESFCAKLESIIEQTDIESVIVTGLGDLQPTPKAQIINFAARYIKRIVPAYKLGNAVSMLSTLQQKSPPMASPASGGDDTAIILYTGGTTGFAKGAMLSHKNIIANMMQMRHRSLLIMEDRAETLAAPLPLYHSYAFLLHCWATPYAGNHSLLIPNPRDLKGIAKLFRTAGISGFVGINTLYLGLLRNEEFRKVDFSKLRFCGAGGMPMTTTVAQEWQDLTGCEVIEGYGLTECSPVVTVNMPGKVRLGTVGPAVAETELQVVGEEGETLAQGETGELWVRGPQVMQGYWEQSEATAEAITSDGWFKTGDYAQISDDGFVTIVDRKKDMILVSGFNVFPNEIEDWVNSHPGIVESAAIGIPFEKTGEAVKLFVVLDDPELSKESIIKYCREGLTAYKVPRVIEFADDLPKSIIGKIIRRELRDS